MSHDCSSSKSEASRTGSIRRRDFGRIIGATAAAGSLGALSFREAGAQTSASASRAAKSDDLCEMTAVDLAARIRRKDVSAREMLAAHLSRIERINPSVNAIVTLVADRAMADAARADEAAARGGALGVLHGLPVVHKDVVDTAGIRTTRGSRGPSETPRRSVDANVYRSKTVTSRHRRHQNHVRQRSVARASAEPAQPVAPARQHANRFGSHHARVAQTGRSAQTIESLRVWTAIFRAARAASWTASCRGRAR